MKYYFLIGLIVLLFVSCIRDQYTADDCRVELFFNMQDVPYVFVGSEAVGYRPYYTFTEHLDLFLFSEDKLYLSVDYDYEYCRTHLVIPFYVDKKPDFYLFVTNLYDPKELNWSFVDGKLVAVFSIINNEEPPVLLSAISQIGKRRDSVPVNLKMLVSRLEIRLTNPPAQVNGLDVSVSGIAASVSSDYGLGDTTHIQKQIFFDNQGPGTYWFGVNTFPTYQNKAALLKIDLIGTSEIAPIIVDDSRLYLLPGVITRLDIEFESESNITISIEIDGKWEVVDGGHIII